MRVIAGSAKGRRLSAPKGLAVRPTSDRVRESLFSIIADRVRGARVLDLYSGSGALAIEALSRGAASAVLVESAPVAVAAIEKNLSATGFTQLAQVRRLPALRALTEMVETGVFDLLFLDPPYTIGQVELAHVLGAAARCISRSGRVVVEHSRDLDPPDSVSGLSLIDRRVYGRTVLSFYEKQED